MNDNSLDVLYFGLRKCPVRLNQNDFKKDYLETILV